MLVSVLAVLIACGSDPAPTDNHVHGPGAHEHDHATAGHEHAAAAPATDHASHHGGGSDHMAQMAATREALRSELGAAYDQPVAGLDTADLTKGKATYDQMCASCHGVAGKGDGAAGAGSNPPPADLTDAFHARYYSDAGRVRIIQKGSPGTTMVGFESSLDAQQILDLYGYVRSLR